MIKNYVKSKIKRAIFNFLKPYLAFFILCIFGVAILFMGVEQLWEEYTSGENTSYETEFMWPIPNYNYISSYYGNRVHPIKKTISFHDGIDIPAPENTKVISPANGIVERVYFSNSLGNSVEVKANEYTFIFYHLNFTSVKEGSNIKRGEQVGGVGTTGTLSTGNHLHFTVIKNNAKIDPLEIVNFNKKGVLKK